VIREHKTDDLQAFSLQLIAARLDVSVRTTRRLIASRALTAHRVGRQWRVLKKDLEAFLAERMNRPA
jgi:excisionase family DNA binding protein